MIQYATVDRFCAIEGTHCQKQIEYKGQDTYFFAYPSRSKWADFSYKLQQELQLRGFHGLRWEDFINNDLIFSKVCEGIYGHDYLLAEVTEPNANVLLEIGYALAVGRLPILLQNSNWQPWTRSLLTTMENCHYETREDIHRYMDSLRAGTRKTPTSPDRRLPFLEKMGIFLEEESRGTVYHLKPKQSADWISRVDKVLKKSYFKLSAMDPSDSVYDEFFPQARQIQRASLIVASLLSNKNIDWEQHNANVSLLIGFAIGLGKRVLVLQHQPLAPILDLGSMARPIETERQAEQIVTSWIDQQTRQNLRETADLHKRAQRRQDADRIRSLYLGHPDALQDSRLLEYFVPTKEFNDAVAGRRTLFIGRRGSGKSANFQAIKEELQQHPDKIVAEIAPDDFELERIAAFVESDYELTNPKLVFQHIWNYVLTIELLRSLADTTDKLYTSPNDPNRVYLHQYYDAHHDEITLDFGSRVIKALDNTIPTSTDLSSSERQARVEEQLLSLRDYELGRRLRDFAKQERLTFFIVADDLDKHWKSDSTQSIDLLLGLIDEVDKIQRFFGPHLKVVVFLREDIHRVLAQFDDDLPKRNFLRLEWTNSNLKHLVAKRLADTSEHDEADDDRVWLAMFPDAVKDLQASDYILSKSLPRPRDVLDFCQRAIDQAQRNGHPHVTAQDILAGETEFSNGLLASLSAEFRGLYPKLEDVLVYFLGIPELLPWTSFEKIALEAIEANKVLLSKWTQSKTVCPKVLSDVFFTIGLLGLSAGWGSESFFSNGRAFSDVWQAAGPKPHVHIHPAFHDALEVSQPEQPSRLPVKSRRRIDPRQMPFDVPE